MKTKKKFYFDDARVVLTDNRTVTSAIELLMAFVMQSCYTTVRHSAAETSGPPQEARHTCSGVCVPIIRLPPLLFPCWLLLYSAFHIRQSFRGKGNWRTAPCSFLPSLVSSSSCLSSSSFLFLSFFLFLLFFLFLPSFVCSFARSLARLFDRSPKHT